MLAYVPGFIHHVDLPDNEVPWERFVGFEEGNHEHQGCHGCQYSHNDSIHPFPIRVYMRYPCVVEVGAVEANDSEGEDELEKADDGVDDEAKESSVRLDRSILPRHCGESCLSRR